LTTYRLYATGRLHAVREFEGENLIQNGQFVQITTDDDNKVVAAFNLEPGQYVADVSTVSDIPERTR
jgi:hypothetical protein